MKKVVSTMFVIMMVISGVYAAIDTDIMLGLSSGYNQLIPIESKNEEDGDIKIPPGSFDGDYVPVKADLLVYMGDGFAFNTALGLDIRLPDNDFSEVDLGFIADVFAYYRLQLIENIDLLAGGGVSYKMYVVDEEAGATLHSVSLMASLRLQFGVTDFLSVFAGADAGYNILNAVYGSIPGGVNLAFSLKAPVIPWAVKAGISYKF